jgi:hypothetical protein
MRSSRLWSSVDGASRIATSSVAVAPAVTFTVSTAARR